MQAEDSVIVRNLVLHFTRNYTPLLFVFLALRAAKQVFPFCLLIVELPRRCARLHTVAIRAFTNTVCVRCVRLAYICKCDRPYFCPNFILCTYRGALDIFKRAVYLQETILFPLYAMCHSARSRPCALPNALKP